MQEDLKDEFKRKAFHITSLLLPIAYIFVSKQTAIITIFIITAATIFLDISRHYNSSIGGVIDKLFSSLMRPFERTGSYKLSGSSYMALGFFISTIIFSKGVAITSCLVLTISDSCAAIFGKKLGTSTNHGKSLEGSLAFFLSAVMVSIFIFQIEAFYSNFWIIVIASLATSAVEYYSHQIGVNDNLTIPVTFGGTISILGAIFL